jgi:hypothetical protein
MTALLAQFCSWFAQRKPPRRYHVTPRYNPHTLRRALLREAMRELKRDPAFASLTAMIPDNNVNHR